MHFPEDAELYGYSIRLVQDLAQKVDRSQWCSDGVLSQYLQMDLIELKGLVDHLHSDGYLSLSGPLPATYRHECLPEETTALEPLRLWHVTDLGKSLAKAFIGEPLTRAEAQSLLNGTIERIRSVMNNPRATLSIETVHLCGSLLNETSTEFGDVDILIRVARSSHSEPHDAASLERMISQGNLRLDIMVFDDLIWPYPIDRNAPTNQLLP
jgi:predicted nucleotidyltransferase